MKIVKLLSVVVVVFVWNCLMKFHPLLAYCMHYNQRIIFFIGICLLLRWTCEFKFQFSSCCCWYFIWFYFDMKIIYYFFQVLAFKLHPFDVAFYVVLVDFTWIFWSSYLLFISFKFNIFFKNILKLLLLFSMVY